MGRAEVLQGVRQMRFEGLLERHERGELSQGEAAEMVGMMLHQDASRFAWLPDDDRQYDLVVTLDDATSAVYSGFLVAEEGTASSFRALSEVLDRHGLFCELYTDRGSHYFHTPKAGEAVSKSVQTQVGRALAQLGIRHIAAYSPEARGRSERAFRTLQDRLPKELTLAGITTLAAANRWLAETYWPAHNAAFAVAPAEAGSALVADRAMAARVPRRSVIGRFPGTRRRDRPTPAGRAI